MTRKTSAAIALGYGVANMKRVDIKIIIADPVQRERLMVACIIAIQAREGITTTVEQAKAAYYAVRQIAYRN